MPPSESTILRASLVVALILATGCTTATKQMTTLPKEPAASGTVRPPQTVVLFRLAVDEGGASVPAPLSARPHGKWFFRLAVSPDDKPLERAEVVVAGQLDQPSADAGWAFLIVPPGRYQFAYSSLRTQFLMPGAHDAWLGRGSSTPYRFEVPSGAGVLYVGTFTLSCQRTDRWWGYVVHECTKLEVRGEQQQAGKIASSALGRFGPMQVSLATTASTAGR